MNKNFVGKQVVLSVALVKEVIIYLRKAVMPKHLIRIILGFIKLQNHFWIQLAIEQIKFEPG